MTSAVPTSPVGVPEEKPRHWNFFQLPPFFTLQPATVSLQRQKSLWADVVLDHAAHYAALSSNDSCSLLRLYSTKSDVFYNPVIKRRLPQAAARVILESIAERHPNQCVLLADTVEASAGSSEGGDVALLVACTAGGLRSVEQSLLSWILEEGSSTTTTTDLAKNGVVLTFTELVEGRALHYKKDGAMMSRLSNEPVPIGATGSIDEEEAIRMLLQAMNSRSVSLLRPYRVTLFNLDGSSKQPYEGVKIGGSG